MKRNELKQEIAADLMRYGYNEIKKPNIIKKRALYGYIYSSTMRKTKYYKSRKNYLMFGINRLYLRYLMFLYGFQIPYSTNISKGLYIGHFGRINVSFNAVIGKNVNLSPGVTIGGTNRGSNKGAPEISNKVWIGTNAIVVGAIKIGENVMICPNSFVNFDVPANSIVIGNPGVIHRNENATDCYIENMCM